MFAHLLTCIVLAFPALGKSARKLNLYPDGGYASSGDENFIADRNREDENLSGDGTKYSTCKYRCWKIQSSSDLKLLIDVKLKTSDDKHKSKIFICPSNTPIIWAFEDSIIFHDQINISIECCGQNCIIDGGLRTEDELKRRLALFNFRNTSHVEVTRMTFQNIPSATFSPGSVFQFEFATDLSVSGSTFKNIRSQNGAINVNNAFGSSLADADTIGKVTLKDNAFMENYASVSGGAIRASGIVELIQNLFHGNHADVNGGSVSVSPGKVFSERNLYEASTAGNDGGALHLERIHAVLKGDKFKNCNADDDGGAVYSRAGKIDIWKSQFYQCRTTGEGGAVYFEEGEFTSQLNQYTANTAFARGGAIYHDDGLLKSSRDLFSKNAADIGGDDVFLEEAIFFYCQTRFSNENPMASFGLSLAEQRCGNYNNKVDGCENCYIIESFADFKAIIENQLEISSGTSVQIQMCANEEPIIWPHDETFMLANKITFDLHCCGGSCKFDGNHVEGDTRSAPAFEFMHVTKFFVDGMVFKNFSPVNRIPPSGGADATVFDFNQVVVGSVSNSLFEGIYSQRGIIYANETAALTLTKNTFLNNRGVTVNGISRSGETSVVSVKDGSLEIVENIVKGNSNSVRYGAIHIDSGFIDSKSNKYIENSSPELGSALSAKTCYMKSTQKDLFYNNTGTFGGAVSLEYGVVETSSTVFEMNTGFWGGAFLGINTVTYISEKSKYLNNEALLGGAISGILMLAVSNGDIFRDNNASLEDFSSSSLTLHHGNDMDRTHLRDSEDEEEEKFVGDFDDVKGKSLLSSLVQLTSEEKTYGDDVLVDFGGFLYCGSVFSGEGSISVVPGAPGLIAEKCFGYAHLRG